MKKEEVKQRVLEQQIFNEVKDASININYLKRKYAGIGINFPSLYRRIVNYQVKTYGRALYTQPSQMR